MRIVVVTQEDSAAHHQFLRQKKKISGKVLGKAVSGKTVVKEATRGFRKEGVGNYCSKVKVRTDPHLLAFMKGKFPALLTWTVRQNYPFISFICLPSHSGAG